MIPPSDYPTPEEFRRQAAGRRSGVSLPHQQKRASAGDIRLVSHLCLRRVHVNHWLAHWLTLRSLSRADHNRTVARYEAKADALKLHRHKHDVPDSNEVMGGLT